MDDLKKEIKTSLSSSNFNKAKAKELKSVTKKVSELDSERRNKKAPEKILFDQTQKHHLKSLREKRNTLQAQKSGKTVLNINGEVFKVKESYLKSLNDPQKYIKGLYGRKIRNYQKKAYKTGNFKAVGSLSRKLKGLDQKQGVSYYKRRKSEKQQTKAINRAFKEIGVEIDDVVTGEGKLPPSPPKLLVSTGKAGVLNVLIT